MTTTMTICVRSFSKMVAMLLPLVLLLCSNWFVWVANARDLCNRYRTDMDCNNAEECFWDNGICVTSPTVCINPSECHNDSDCCKDFVCSPTITRRKLCVHVDEPAPLTNAPTAAIKPPPPTTPSRPPKAPPPTASPPVSSPPQAGRTSSQTLSPTPPTSLTPSPTPKKKVNGTPNALPTATPSPTTQKVNTGPLPAAKAQGGVTACPPVGSKSVLAAGQHKLSISTDLCTLSKATKSGTGDITTLIPVARSYSGYNWEVAPGSYAAKVLSQSSIACNNNGACSLELPTLSNNDFYVLSSYQHSLSEMDQRARFLEMTTFGTTQSDLDTWNFKDEEQWIMHHVKRVPPTSHREYWRRRANPRWMYSQAVGRSDHPCSKNSRWRRFTFTRKDRFKGDDESYPSGFLKVKPITPDGPFILFVDGHARTVVPEWRWNSDNINGFFPTWDPDYEYKICVSPHQFTKSLFSLQTKPYKEKKEGSCVEIDRSIGNPAVNFTGFESLMGPNVFTLPNDGSLQNIDEWKDGGNIKGDDRYILVNGLNDAMCNSVPQQAEDYHAPVFGIHPTEGLLQWDPRLILEENTLNSPMPDGGGETEVITEGRTACANVARTFQNANTCVLSRQSTTCGSVPAPDAIIELTRDNILQLQGMTERYLYAIQGLKVKQEEFSFQIQHPCTPGRRSRWEKQAERSCEKPTALQSSTSQALERLLSETRDENPYVRDITFPTSGTTCDKLDTEVEIQIQVGSDCWTHVHPHYLGVFDLTWWAHPKNHPGNEVAEKNDEPNPITKWAERRDHYLNFPSHHPMDRWESNFREFPYVGRLGDSVSYRDLPSTLQIEEVAEHFGVTSKWAGSGVIVCGSPGEIANDPTIGSDFDVASDFYRDTSLRSQFGRQRGIVWTMIALYGKDQLRQRMAFVLSQILVIANQAIDDEGRSTEAYVSFYDIFVRNAFGNYLDILREVSYSPLMADNLSYHKSKSSAYVWEQYMTVEAPDENFSREIMQLFTTGLIHLNLDGTPKLDEKGKTTQVYDNDDIRSFARAWTGFSRQFIRGNIEQPDDKNRIDPMQIQARWRDRFPKTDLYGGYIGDRYPLCVDLPPKQFLRRGSKYRLLGSSAMPELMDTDHSLYTKRFVLNPTSSLFTKLCNKQGFNCQFQNEVILYENLGCNGLECQVDTVRVVQVLSGVFYEYIQPPCVEHPFYDNGMKLNKEYRRRAAVCGNPLLPVATSACCRITEGWTEAKSENLYDIERMKFETQDKRCKALGKMSCEYDRVDKNSAYWINDVVYHWAVTPCNIQVKVNPQGEAAIVHKMPIEEGGEKVLHVSDDTRNYFGVSWTRNDFPQQAVDNCGVCQPIEGTNCLCDTRVKETMVFDSNPANAAAILSALQIGAPDPRTFDEGTYKAMTVNGYIVHKTGGAYALDTIFEVKDTVGRTHFLKNAKSTVFLQDGSGTLAGFSFRNPVQFMSLIPSEGNARDAMYETEATLEHYFYHDNTAPFLCTRFIQRFGISNASPRYVKSCATAFRSGTHRSGTAIFGSGKYGCLEATVAAIVLDREARTAVLDADPAHGAIREPLIKVISLMRNLDFRLKDTGGSGESPMVIFNNMDSFIGEMAYEFESVFSFFLPEFEPAGFPKGLVSPESQLLDMPKTIGILNGMQSLIKYGLAECSFLDPELPFDFVGELRNPVFPAVSKDECTDGSYAMATGYFRWKPSASTSKKTVDELATLLTSGRLSAKNKRIIMDVYEDAVAKADVAAGLRIAQQLIATTPEFHSTSRTRLSGEAIQKAKPPPHGGRPYKAIVYLMFVGGCDSFNMLVPKDCSAHNKYVEARNPAHMTNEDLLSIDGSGQVGCKTFGVHKNLGIVRDLYNDGDLLFFANTGVLGKPTTRETYSQDTPTQLFAHNSMLVETKAVDIFHKTAGFGVLGRLTDALTKSGVSTSSIAIDATSRALTGRPGSSPAPVVLSQYGIVKFMPKDAATMTKKEMTQTIKDLNNATEVDSGFMAQMWSSSLIQSLDQNEELYQTLQETQVETDFGELDLGRKFEVVSRMIKSRKQRRSDMDVFYLEVGGFDTHADMEAILAERFYEVNEGLSAFVQELKNQDVWDNVVIVQASEFARTLSPNSGFGTDHGWGGNYFMCGGAVQGGKILGEYPSDMTEHSEINVGRGRLIPTTAWDQIWPGIARWAGAKESDVGNICPNREQFPSFFTKEMLFTAPTSNS